MNQQALKVVIAGLQQDTELLAELGKVLQQQYILMSLRQSEQLEQLNQQAQQLLTKLQLNATERQNAMQQMQLPLSEQGIETLLAMLPEKVRNPSRQLFDKVQQHTQICQQLNQKNGELLAYQRGLMQKLLGLDDKTQYPQLQMDQR
ncbi:flagellar export chaperone FlgN [Rheinheimera sp.]|uniref:flagellar export chaperone FlgN n=1 Tax=Rheinheimera sp. TaxID=1869214 RepID=UPI002FDE2862